MNPDPPRPLPAKGALGRGLPAGAVGLEGSAARRLRPARERGDRSGASPRVREGLPGELLDRLNDLVIGEAIHPREPLVFGHHDGVRQRDVRACRGPCELNAPPPRRGGVERVGQ